MFRHEVDQFLCIPDQPDVSYAPVLKPGLFWVYLFHLTPILIVLIFLMEYILGLLIKNGTEWLSQHHTQILTG